MTDKTWDLSRSSKQQVKDLNLENEKFKIGIAHTFKLNCDVELGDVALQVTMGTPDAAVVNLTPTPGSNSYLCEIMPKEIGNHQIYVLHNDKHILGSPFNVQFMPCGDASKCRIINNSVENLEENTDTIIFCVSTEEAGIGTLTASVEDTQTHEQVPVTITHTSKVLHNIKFTIPSEADSEYFLTVKYDKEHIVGSPFKLVFTPDSEASKCFAMGEGLIACVVGESGSFLIDPGDNGLVLDKLSVTIQGESGTTVEPLTSIVNDKNLKVEYIAHESGEYKISVAWDGHPIPNSPFGVTCHIPADSSMFQIVDAKCELFQDEPLNFTVKASSNHGDGKLTVVAQSSKGNTTGIVHRVDDSTFFCSTEMLTAGKYMVYINWNGTHIPGSPFQLKVIAPPQPHKVKAYGPGLEDGELGQEACFTVETHEGGTGTLTVQVHGPNGAFKINQRHDPENHRTILVDYNPNHVGKYTVEITWSDTHIPGSPFVVQIKEKHERLARELWEAVESNDSNKVRYLLEQGADPEHRLFWSKEWQNFPPLHKACSEGYLQIVEAFVDHRADADKGDANGQSPLDIALMSDKPYHDEGCVNAAECLVKIGYGNNKHKALLLCGLCRWGTLDRVKDLVEKHGVNPNNMRDEKDRTPLCHACKAGNKDIVVYLIEQQGCSIDVRSVYDQTPLLYACSGGNLDTVVYLIEQRHCSVDVIAEYGRTPLHLACSYGSLETVTYLVEQQQCSVGVRDKYNKTPLHYACSEGNLEIVSYLFEQQHCSVDTRGMYNKTPLHYACWKGNLETVVYLIEQQYCNVDVRDEDGRTPIHDACSGGKKNIVEYLIEKRHCSVDVRDKSKKTPLHHACWKGNLETVVYLTEQKHCSADVKDVNNQTPLHLACFEGKEDTVEYLVELQHCSVDARTTRGRTPLHCACWKGNLDTVVYLIEKQHCSVGVRDRNNKTALHLACSGGQKDIVEYLVEEQHCNIDMRTTQNRTALHYACWKGNLETVGYLIEEQHCSTDVIDEDNRTPLHLACSGGKEDIVEYLTAHQNCNVDVLDKFNWTPLYLACLMGNLETVVYLIEQQHCSVDVRNKDNKTPLHLACSGGKKSTAEYLIEKQHCSADVKDNFDMTPLQCACLEGNLETVVYLIEQQHCNIDVRNNKQRALLHLACSGGKTDIVVYLIEQKHCDVDVRDKYEMTPLHCGIYGGNLETVVYLVEKQHCSVAVTDDLGKTPLDLASEEGDTEIVEYLKIGQQSSTKPGVAKNSSSQIPIKWDPAQVDQHASHAESAMTENTADTTHSDSQDTRLTEEDFDALRKLLQVKKVKLSLSKDQITLTKVQQLLNEKGHKDLAANLRAKIDAEIQVQQHTLKQLQKLMTDKDTFYLCYLRLLLVGPPFVGKTTTLNRLLKVFENIQSGGDAAKQRSTLLANCTQVLAFVNEDTADWLASKDVDEEAKLLFSYLYGCETNEAKKTSISTAMPKPTSKPRGGMLDLKESEQEDELKKPRPPKARSVKVSRESQQPSRTERRAAAYNRHRLALIKSRLQKVIKSGDYTKMASLLSNTLLNITDVGGQPGFLEMLPTLMRGPAMYLVFVDLSKELDKCYKIPFSRDDTVITPFDAMHTVESTISQILSSIASVHCIQHHSSTFKPEKIGDEFSERFRKFQEVKPVAAVIGTHKDKLVNPEEEIKEKNETLKKVIQRFEKILVTPSESASNVSFFSVDNMAGTEQSEMTPLRDFMSKIFSTRFKDASLPIKKKWLIMGIILRREFKIAKMEDCYAISNMLEMDKEETDTCLLYLDGCVGTIMLYTNIPDDDDGWFKTRVICSPQVVFDSTSKLIVASLRTLHCEGHVTEFERNELMKKGQFSLESIEMFCQSAEVVEELEKEELIPAKQLIKLLKHVNLLSPITHSENAGDNSKEPRVTYLMPTILDCSTREELANSPKPDANNPLPIHITFEFGFVPTGAFCGLVTKIVSEGPEKILGLTWAVVEDGVKRNCVSFYVAKSNKVTLIAHERSYEIRVFRAVPKMSLSDLCSYVLSVMLYMLKKLYQHLVPQIAFQCPCPDHESDKDNLCIMSEDFWVQFLCGNKPVTLTKHQQVWLGKVVACNCCVDIEVLQYAEDDFSFQWSKKGSKHQLMATSVPNSLTFQSVSERDFGYYKCEVQEAGKVVLTVYRALYKDEPAESLDAAPSVSAKAVQSSVASNVSSGVSQDCTSYLGVLRKAVWDVRAKWEDLAIDLGIPMGTCDAIDTDHRGKVERCFTAMLHTWLQSDPRLEDLFEGLRGPVVDRADLADEVEEKVKAGKLVLWKSS